MTVPTDNLYDFVHQVTEKQHWVVYFWPWGNRDLANAKWYHHDFKKITDPINGIDYKDIIASKIFSEELIEQYPYVVKNLQSVLFCHDQEPLNWSHYNDTSPYQLNLLVKTREDTGVDYLNQHLRLNILHNWQKRWILLHSELNSPELEKYEQNNYVGAYWWSHAVISRDWYRYAEYDPSLRPSTDQTTFLVYCRDVTGSRTYRKTFLDSINRELSSYCQIGSVNADNVSSDSSASYDSLDFNLTAISVVLETVFDQRIHLTEKTLRPIACGHPFILAAGPGSLKLLEHYGFKTFSPWINESYDLESDPDKRLQMIVDEMHRLSTHPNLSHVIEQCRAVAEYNKRRFFSSDFLHMIANELRDNVRLAHKKTLDCLDPTFWINERKRKRKEKILSPDNLVQRELIRLARWTRLNKGSFKEYQSHQRGLDHKSNTDGNDV